MRPEHDPSGASAVAEGAHLGAYGGAFDVLQRHYLGFSVGRDGIALDPAPPPGLGRVRVELSCRFGRFELEWTGSALRLRSDAANPAEVLVSHAAGADALRPGGEVTVAAS